MMCEATEISVVVGYLAVQEGYIGASGSNLVCGGIGDFWATRGMIFQIFQEKERKIKKNRKLGLWACLKGSFELFLAFLRRRTGLDDQPIQAALKNCQKTANGEFWDGDCFTRRQGRGLVICSSLSIFGMDLVSISDTGQRISLTKSQHMKLVLYQIKDAIINVMRTFFTSDLDVMSDEVREILSNPEDAKLYREAVNKIEKGQNEVTIELSNKNKLTLVQ